MYICHIIFFVVYLGIHMQLFFSCAMLNLSSFTIHFAFLGLLVVAYNCRLNLLEIVKSNMTEHCSFLVHKIF